jgi:hypothetical protein
MPVLAHVESLVWPLLRERGFTLFGDATAWRRFDGGVDVVGFRVLDELSAGALGCPPGSFFLDLGVHLDAVPGPHPEQRDGRLAPRPDECQVTRRLPPAKRRSFHGETRIWVVEPDGANLGPVFGDALSKLRRALPGFDRFHGPRRALDALARAGRWHPHPGDEAWLEVTAYLAIAAGEYDVARARLERLLAETDSRRGRLRRALEMLPR